MIWLLALLSFSSWAQEANPAQSRNFFSKRFLSQNRPSFRLGSLSGIDGSELKRFAPTATCGSDRRSFVPSQCAHPVGLGIYYTPRRHGSEHDHTSLAVDGLSVGIKTLFTSATVKRFEIELIKGHF